jgi:single-strand DNA-binding protein
MNEVVLIGRLTRDPELKTTNTGTSVVRFTLAVDRRFTKDKADFIDITAWRKTAEFVDRYFRKGNRVAVHGSIQTHTWTDDSGNNRKGVEIVAENVEFADSKRTSADAGDYAADAARSGDFREVEGDDEELPWKD